MFQLLEPFPLPASSGSSEAPRNLRFFVSSCSSPGLFLLQLHFAEYSFPLFLHFSLLVEILPQLLWSHTFISSRLSWLAFGFHSYWLSLMGCVQLFFHPSHLLFPPFPGSRWKGAWNSSMNDVVGQREARIQGNPRD